MKKVSLQSLLPFSILLIIAIAAIFVPSIPSFNNAGKYRSADTTWTLIATGVITVVMSFIVFKFINWVMPIRVSPENEIIGLDASQHNEKYGRRPELA